MLTTTGASRAKASGKVGKPVSLEGKTDAFDMRYVVKDGAIVIDYKVKGDKYIETLRQFSGDFTIRYDFKPEEGCNNDTLLMGTKFDILAGKTTLKGVKVGEWNKMQVTCQAGKITSLLNGVEVAKGEKAEPDKGAIGWQSEGKSIRFRDLRIKTLP